MSDRRLRIIPLGGVGEVGKNCTLFEYGDCLFLVDVGVKFPEESLHGIDLVVPDFSYVLEREENLAGLVFTHGHEDHIGALPFLLMQLDKSVPIPIYGSRLTLGLIEAKLREFGFTDKVEMHEVRAGESFSLGPFELEPLDVNHSVPDSMAFTIRSPVGVVFHTGDFKFDPEPPEGRTTDVEALRRIGDEGVLALLSDCVRVEQRGWTPSERIVDETLSKILAEAPGRVIITTFASNLGRLKRAILTAHGLGKRVAVVGRAMDENLKIASELGFLDAPPGAIVPLREVHGLPPDRVVLLTTGSQGEPTSALARIAVGDHPHIKISPTDTVVFSATPVPGNEETTFRTIDNLFRRGARVIYRALLESVHVSGHGSREELKQMVELIRPQYCLPIHGEVRMQFLYRDVAEEAGIEPEKVIITEIGQVVELARDGVRKAGTVPSGSVLVDGLTVGGVTRVVLRDRRRLAQEGVVIAAVALDRETGEVVGGPDLISRGFVAPEAATILEDARPRLEKALRRALRGEPEYGYVADKIRDVLRSYIYEETRRRPMILPVVTEV